MKQALEQRLAVLAEVSAACMNEPIDLLDRDDADGEQAYLYNARFSYERTIADLADMLDERSREGCPLRVLEIGAFLGIVSLTLARLGCQVTACDIPEFMGNPRLQQRFAASGVRTLAFNLREYPLPLATSGYDLVVMCETLEHLNFNPLPVLAELNRALTPGGKLYLALPNQASLPNRAKLLAGRSIHNPVADFHTQLSQTGNLIVGLHWREYTRAEVLGLLASTGFSCDRHHFVPAQHSSLPARFLYGLFPTLRPFQVLFASKTETVMSMFHFTSATKP